MAPASTDPVEDFRVRTARLRRARTSRRLCAAALEVIAERGVDGLGVDEVRVRAELSRGAFYRYFATSEALLEHLAAAVGAQVNSEMGARFEAVDDPALRIGLFFRYQVTRVMSDRPCALLFSRAVALRGASSGFAHERAARDFQEAADTGRFALASVPAAVDLAHGVLAAALRRATEAGLEQGRLSLEAAFLLRACGVEAAEADRLAAVSLDALPLDDLRQLVVELCTAP